MGSNIAITEKKKNKSHISNIPKKKNKSRISNMPEAFWDKVTDFTDERIVQCDVPAVKSTSLDDGNNDDRK